MSFTEKIDVLDLIIKVLEEHEAKLDALITELESLIPERRELDDVKRMLKFHDQSLGEC